MLLCVKANWRRTAALSSLSSLYIRTLPGAQGQIALTAAPLCLKQIVALPDVLASFSMTTDVVASDSAAFWDAQIAATSALDPALKARPRGAMNRSTASDSSSPRRRAFVSRCHVYVFALAPCSLPDINIARAFAAATQSAGLKTTLTIDPLEGGNLAATSPAPLSSLPPSSPPPLASSSSPQPPPTSGWVNIIIGTPPAAGTPPPPVAMTTSAAAPLVRRQAAATSSSSTTNVLFAIVAVLVVAILP